MAENTGNPADSLAPTRESGTVGPNPGEAEIAALAYRLWQAKGCPTGSDQEDWFLAESMLKSRSEEEPPVSE